MKMKRSENVNKQQQKTKKKKSPGQQNEKINERVYEFE